MKVKKFRKILKSELKKNINVYFPLSFSDRIKIGFMIIFKRKF